MIYALDTNIISYVLNGNTAIAEKLTAVTKAGNKVIIPLLAYHGVRRGLLNDNAVKKMGLFDRLCSRLNVDGLTAKDMDAAAAIYDRRKRIGAIVDDADILIAAQCINNNCTLITNNVRHFKNSDGLIYENWME